MRETSVRLNFWKLVPSKADVNLNHKVNITDLVAFTSDNVPVIISGSLFFRVSNSYDACFSVDNFEQNVANIGTSAIRSIVGNFSVCRNIHRRTIYIRSSDDLKFLQYDEVIGDRNKMNKKLHEVIGSSISVCLFISNGQNNSLIKIILMYSM